MFIKPENLLPLSEAPGPDVSSPQPYIPSTNFSFSVEMATIQDVRKQSTQGIFVPKGHELKRVWRKLQNKEIHDLHSFPGTESR